MGGFNISHGLFISASFADEMTKRLWELTVAFFISPVKFNGERKGGGVCRSDIHWLDNSLNYCYAAHS
jgi:hypothetical protein